jgi:hypothetical protein
VKGSGAQGLLGAGDLLISLNSELIRFQAAGVSHAEVTKAVDLILACSKNYPQPERRNLGAPASAQEPNRPRLISRAWSGE